MLHDNRKRAGSFGDDAEQYDRARPSYPTAMVDDLVAEFVDAGVGGCGRVLDVGCGTGIVARLFEDRGCTVVGVEADPRMAAVAARHGVDVDVVAFEQWTPRGGPVDLVTSGQAWHWIDPAVGPAKAAQVLRPGGALAAFWHSYHYEAAFHQSVLAVYRELAPDLAEDSLALATIPADAVAEGRRSDIAAIEACGLFEAPDERTYTMGRRYTGEEWIDELATHSSHRVADRTTLDAVFVRLAEVVDASGGIVEIDLHTDLLLVRLASRSWHDTAASPFSVGLR